MKTAFLLFLALGFGGVLGAAHFVPWVAHARLASQTSVVANGGRAERFIIRLPVDRIAASGTPAVGMRASPTAGGSELPTALQAEPLLVEHFKVRDAGGNVIGLAARHWSVAAGRAGSAWSLLIPSRGALLLTAPGEAQAAIDSALQRAGRSPGGAWNGEVRVPLVPPGDAAGTVSAGTAEFRDLEGRYSETWFLTGVSEAGELRGTIELDTVTNRGS